MPSMVYTPVQLLVRALTVSAELVYKNVRPPGVEKRELRVLKKRNTLER
jgi:hypothetical protein